ASRLSPPRSDEGDEVADEVVAAIRRRTISDQFLRSVAGSYTEGGWEAVMEDQGPASKSQVFRWIKAARERGILRAEERWAGPHARDGTRRPAPGDSSSIFHPLPMAPVARRVAVASPPGKPRRRPSTRSV